MTERIIQREVRRFFTNYEYILFNAFMFNWESDFFCLSKQGYSTEVEIKCTKADYRKDFSHKVEKHKMFTNHKKPVIIRSKYPFKPYLRPPAVYDPDKHEFKIGDSSFIDLCCPADHLPNKFYYACPEGLIKLEELPTYAGLIYVEEYTNKFGIGYNIKEIKRAPFLHKKVKDHQSSLLSKYYWKHKNDRYDILQLLNVLDKDNLTSFQRSALKRIMYKLS